jgi:integrase
LSAIKSVEVESWLRNLKTAKGNPASPGTRTKIRNWLSTVFSHAIRYEWAARNPISPVRSSAKRLRTPDILTPEEFQALIAALSPRERVIVLLAGSTGLRRGELIGLRWSDIDLEARQANVTRSVWRNVEGETKTEASRKPVPLHQAMVEELKQWQRVTLYRSDEDFVFPSIAKNGTQPISPDMILKRHIRPALKQIGVTKRIGFHSFRHGLATMLRQRVSTSRRPRNYCGMPTAGSRWRSTNRLSAKKSEKPRTESWACCSLKMKKARKDQTLQHPWRPIESNNLSRKPMFLLSLWRGRRGSNPRPLP